MTVRLLGAGSGRPATGWAIPVSSRRRASARAFALPGTGVPVPPARHLPGPGRAEPQHPGGLTARDHRPAVQRARPRIGPQPESRRDQLVTWSLSCMGHRTVWLP